MTGRRARVIVGFLAASALAMLVCGAPATARSVGSLGAARPGAPTFGQVEEIGIASQPFHVVSPVNARFSLQLPASVTSDATMQFLLQRRVANRDSFRAIADRFAEPGVIDTVTIAVRRGVVSGSATSFDVLLNLVDKGTNALTMPQPGVYPLVIRAVGADGALQASVLTFLDRRDATVSATGTPVSVIGILQGPVSHMTDGTIAIDDTTRVIVQQFIEFLRSTRSPLTLQVQPELIEAFATSPDVMDNQQFEQLRAELNGRSIVTSTYLPIDASTMVHDNLSQEFTQQLRLGESVLSKYLPGTVLHRGTWIAAQSIDTPTLEVLRGLGLTTLVLLPGAAGAVEHETSPEILARPSGAANRSTGVLTVDEPLASTIDNAGNDSVRLGVRIAAELLTGRDDLVARGTVESDVRMVVASSFGDVLDGNALAQAIGFLSTSAGMSVQDLGGQAVVNERHPVVNFPKTVDRSLGGLRAAIAQARNELTAIGAMLPQDDERRAWWAGALAAASSDNTSNPAEYVDALRSDMRRVTGAVSLVTPSSITLSSRSGAIRLQIRNNDTAPLTVRVRVSSPKISFTSLPSATQLAPGGTTEVSVPVRARSNGRFSVTIRVVTPNGRVQVVSPGVISVRVTSVAGLGQLVSITLLLVILAWWWSHHRRSLRDEDEDSTVASQ